MCADTKQTTKQSWREREKWTQRVYVACLHNDDDDDLKTGQSERCFSFSRFACCFFQRFLRFVPFCAFFSFLFLFFVQIHFCLALFSFYFVLSLLERIFRAHILLRGTHRQHILCSSTALPCFFRSFLNISKRGRDAKATRKSESQQILRIERDECPKKI